MFNFYCLNYFERKGKNIYNINIFILSELERENCFYCAFSNVFFINKKNIIIPFFGFLFCFIDLFSFFFFYFICSFIFYYYYYFFLSQLLYNKSSTFLCFFYSFLNLFKGLIIKRLSPLVYIPFDLSYFFRFLYDLFFFKFVIFLPFLDKTLKNYNFFIQED